MQDGKAHRAPVTTGLQVGDEVEVVSGLSGDEPVVRAPPPLTEGQPVEAP